MRIAGHLLATLVLVPYVVLALGFVLLGQAIASGSLAGFLLTLLSQAVWLVPWGALAIVGSLAMVAALGFSARLRWVAGACVAAIAAASLLAIGVLGSSPLGAGELTFPLPCLAAGGFGAWLAVAEKPARPAGLAAEADRPRAL